MKRKPILFFVTIVIAVLAMMTLVACGDKGGGTKGLASFDNLTFEDATLEYDGTEHKIEVKGAPAGATIEYDNNTATEIGEYNATVTVSKDGYNPKTLNAKMIVMPSAKLLVSARTLAKNDNVQNYDFYLNLAGTVDALGITQTANANYDGKYRYNQDTGAIKFWRQTSGVLLVDSTEYIYTQNDAKVKVVANDKGEVKKTAIIPAEDEELNLINIPFVSLVNALKEENVKKIELSGRTDYKYVATIGLHSDNAIVSRLLSMLEKLGTEVNLKGVAFSNPMGVSLFFNIGSDKKLVDFKLSADISFPVKGVNVQFKLTYLQKANSTEVVIPSVAGLITEKDAVAREMATIENAITALKNSNAYSIDLEAKNEFDPAWNINATVDKYVARMYKNTDAETGRVDFNHSFVYNAHTVTDDKDKFKFTIGNIKTGDVYRISRKGTNTSTKLEGVSADGQFDYLMAVAKANASDVDCIKKVEKDGKVLYYIYLNDGATHGVQGKITNVINSNPTDETTDVENYFNAEQNQIDESEMVVEMKDGAIVSINIKTEIRYCPTGGEYTERNIVLTNEIVLKINDKLTTAQAYVAPKDVSTSIGGFGLNNANFYIL